MQKTFLDKIPVYYPSGSEEEPFIQLIDKIIGRKSHDPMANTLDLEKEIDEMIFKLYGLTEEEIKIVAES